MFYGATTWPSGFPPGTEHHWQVIVQDDTSIHGIVLSNAVHGIQP